MTSKLGDANCSRMKPESLPSLGLNIDLSISVQQPQQQHKGEEQQQQQPMYRHSPVQLDLLPRPIAQHAATKNTTFLWQSLFSGSREPADAAAAAAEPLNSASCKGSPSRGAIDVNQIPSSAETEDVAPASPHSMLSSFQLEPRRDLVSLKRERENEDNERVCEITSSRASDEEEGTTRKKLRLSKEQSALLEESFREHSTLNPQQKQKNALAKQLNLRPRQVEVWFQNRRARTKLKQTEVDCELLKRCCEGLTEENRRLQKELQELRALKVAPPCVITHDFYMPLPATTLTMCPSCERLATVDSNRSSLSLSSSKPGLVRYSQSSAAC